MKIKNLTQWFALLSILIIFSTTMFRIVSKETNTSEFTVDRGDMSFKIQCIRGVSYLFYVENNGHTSGLSPYFTVEGGARQCSEFDTIKYEKKCIDNVAYIKYELGNGHHGGFSPMFGKDGNIENCTY